MTAPQIAITLFMVTTITIVYCQYETKYKPSYLIWNIFTLLGKLYISILSFLEISIRKNGKTLCKGFITLCFISSFFIILLGGCLAVEDLWRDLNTPKADASNESVSTPNLPTKQYKPSYIKDEHGKVLDAWAKNPIACKNEYTTSNIYISGVIEDISDPMFKLGENHNVAFIYVKCSTCGETVCVNIKNSSEYANRINAYAVGDEVVFIGLFYDIMWGNVRIDCN